MKTLLLTATILTATGAVAALAAPAADNADAPAAVAVPPQNPFAVASSPYERLTQAARAQFEAKDFAGAQKTTEAALALAQTDKEKSDALRRIGQIFDAQEQYDKAREFWQRALPLAKDAPEDALTLDLMIGQSYYKQEKWQSFADATIPLMATLNAEDNAEKSMLRVQMAEAYSKLGRENDAREQLLPIVDDEKVIGQIRVVGQLNLASSYQKAGELNNARRYFEAMMKIPEISGDFLISAYQGLGEVAASQNRGDDAKTAFDNARNLYMQKASGQFDAKDFDGAIVSYRAALDISTPDPRFDLVAHQQIGTALQSQKKYDEARAEYQLILDTKLDPADANRAQILPLIQSGAYIGIANGYIAQKQFDKARAALDEMLAMPDLLAPFRMSAEALSKKLPPKADADARNP